MYLPQPPTYSFYIIITISRSAIPVALGSDLFVETTQGHKCHNNIRTFLDGSASNTTKWPYASCYQQTHHTITISWTSICVAWGLKNIPHAGIDNKTRCPFRPWLESISERIYAPPNWTISVSQWRLGRRAVAALLWHWWEKASWYLTRCNSNKVWPWREIFYPQNPQNWGLTRT